MKTGCMAIALKNLKKSCYVKEMESMGKYGSTADVFILLRMRKERPWVAR